LSEELQKNINASGNKQGELFWFENCFSLHKTRAHSRRNPANFISLTMKKFLSLLAFLTFFFSFMNQSSAQQKQGNADLENTLYIELKNGRVVIELLPKIAPKHVERIKLLARQKFYDGIVFHRVIDGFMAQTGDPTGTGMGGSKLSDIKAEFSDEPHIRGAVSMARASDPNSGNSQFFIVTKDSRFLDSQYTVWGRVIKGMELVDQIKKGGGRDGKVIDPDRMVTVRVAVDVERVR
jgi:cyclophilin family peptidyl-prolyl cis-trans isomerase